MKIRTILLSFFIIVLSAAIFGNLKYSHDQAMDSLQKEVKDRLEVTASSRAASVQYYIDENINKIRAISGSIPAIEFLRLAPADMDYNHEKEVAEKRLSSFLEGGFYEIFIIGSNGTVLLSTSGNMLGDDLSRDGYFLNGSKGVYSGDVHLDNGRRIITYSAPIFDFDTHKLLGVVIVESDISVLDSIMMDHTGLGETGESFLINKDKYLITPSRFLENSTFNNIVETENSRNCFSHEILSEEEIIQMHSKILIIPGYRSVMVVATHFYIPSKRWCLLVDVNEAEALGTYEKQFRNSLVASILISLIIVIMIAMILDRIISRPINSLAGKINEITKGNLDIELDRSRIEEIHELNDSLNRILSSLKLAVLKVGIKRSELEIGEVIKAKEEAERKYEDLFDLASDAIILLDSKVNIIKVNKTALDLSGYKKEEIEGKNLMLLNLLPMKSKMIAMDNFRKRIQGKEVPPYEVEIVTKDGRTLIADVAASSIMENGKITGTMAIMRDVTEKKRSEDALKKKTEDLERFAKLVIGREERMIELKKRINELERRLERKGR